LISLSKGIEGDSEHQNLEEDDQRGEGLKVVRISKEVISIT
jgi:hypothetical protein